MRKRRRRNTIIWTIIGVLILIAGWFSFGPGIPSKTQSKTVTVGVVTRCSYLEERSPNSQRRLWHYD